jgi:threonylcarbamoyladenosine tRNA methylthiotransferase MtaB
LRATGEAALRKRLAAEVGATRAVLIESDTQGRTEHFLPVAIRGDAPGAVRSLVVTGNDGARLTVRERRGEVRSRIN